MQDDDPKLQTSAGFKLSLEEKRELRQYAKSIGRTPSDVLRIGMRQQIDGVKIVADDTDSFRAPDLGAVPCGPLAAAVAEARDFTINRDVADELLPKPGDVWMRANGDSMRGAGIHNSMMVLVRPYGRKFISRGHIVAVQITDSDENVTATIKRFDGMENNHETFIDGDGNDYDLPDDTVHIEILGQVVAVLGALE